MDESGKFSQGYMQCICTTKLENVSQICLTQLKLNLECRQLIFKKNNNLSFKAEKW